MLMFNLKSKLEELQERGLIRIKEDGDFLVVKFHKKVFYKGLWDEDPFLTECRGLVLDQDFNPVSVPFHKVFNYGENGTTVDRDTIVTGVRKVNGFLGVLTAHKGKPVFSTTGTVSSDFAALAEESIRETCNQTVEEFLEQEMGHEYTFMFEIVHKNDPHIVKEPKFGAYLIGRRLKDVKLRTYAREADLDLIAEEWGFPRPEHSQGRFGDFVQASKSVDHEGFMIRGPSGQHLLKLKSTYYLTTKFLARGRKKLEDTLSDPKSLRRNLDEEFYGVAEYIVNDLGLVNFLRWPEQERISVIEDYFIRNGGFGNA